MSKIKIIAMDRSLATSYVSNAEYNMSTNKAYPINDGDQITLMLASIDSRKLDDNTLVLSTDQQLTMTYSYFDNDYTEENKKQLDISAAWPAPTFNLYSAYRESEGRTVQEIELSILGFNAFTIKDPFTGADKSPIAVSNNFIMGGSFLQSDLPAGHAANFTMIVNYVDADTKEPKQRVMIPKKPSQADIIKYGPKVNANAAVASILHPPWSQSPPIGTPVGKWPFPSKAPLDPPEGWYAYKNTVTMVPLDGQTMNYVTGTLKYLTATGEWPGNNTKHDGIPDGLGKYLGGSIYPGLAPLFGAYPTVNTRSVPVKSSQFSFNENNVTSVSYSGSTGRDLIINNATITMREGTYTPESYISEFNQQLAKSGGINPVSSGNELFQPANNFLLRTDASGAGTLVFRVIDDTGSQAADFCFNETNTYQYTEPTFYGADQVAFESKNGVINETYAHMPVYDPVQEGQEQIGVKWTGTEIGNDLDYHIIKQSSGIVWHSLEPASWWTNEIGLYDQLIVPLIDSSNGVKFFDKKSMENKIGSGFSGLSGFMQTKGTTGKPTTIQQRTMGPIPPTITGGGDTLYEEITGQTDIIPGNTTNANVNGGYYLLQIRGFPERENLDDNEGEISDIVGIVSKEYNSNNIITGFGGDSGIDFTYRGLPTSIQDFTIRILDPLTKLPVTDLGPKTALMFRIVSPLEPLAPPVKPRAATVSDTKN